MEKLCGKWASDITDLICEIIAVYYVYENGDVKAKYHLYNKKIKYLMKEKKDFI